MSREISIFPSGEIAFEKSTNGYPVCRVWAAYIVEIERVIGVTPLHPQYGRQSVCRTITYPNPTVASKERLAKVITRLVNKGPARILLFPGGYEAEL